MEFLSPREREFFIDNLMVRTHYIIVMIRWTGLAPWEFEFPFPGSLVPTRAESGRASQDRYDAMLHKYNTGEKDEQEELREYVVTVHNQPSSSLLLSSLELSDTQSL